MANRKLTDTQLVILSGAAARESGLVLPLPKSVQVNRGTQTIVLRGLLKKELVAERPAQPDEEIWETSEDGSRTTLVITDAGLSAVGIEEVTNGGGDAAPDPRVSMGKPAPGPVGLKKRKSAPATATVKAAKAAAPAEPGKDTKLGTLIAALRRKKGATIDEMMEATGWQAHSVRGAISGALKKKLGLEVVSEVSEGKGRVYRIGGDAA